jgi:DNA-binding NarL/FixJ family response regulator
MPVSIIIFEDNDQLRESLVTLLNNSEGYQVAGDHRNVMDAANIIRRYRPDVVIMDDLPEKRY